MQYIDNREDQEVIDMRLMARTTEVLALRSFAIRGGRHNGKEYDTY